MTGTHKKRPRDLNQLAKLIVDIATGDEVDLPPTPEQEGKSDAAVKRGKLGGPKGGTARAASLPPEERRRIAQKAAAARWSKT